MNNIFKLNKIQYITEQFTLITISFVMLSLFFRYPDEKKITAIVLSLSLIIILIVEVLKYKRKWFRSKDLVPSGITRALRISAIIVIYLSYFSEGSHIYAIIYPPTILALLSFVNYRLNFGKKIG